MIKKETEGEILKDVIGFFDGENFISENGDRYPVSPNYASKSCLVKGDELRLRITSSGEFIYKQINLVARKSLIGMVVETEMGTFVVHEGNMYKVLNASATFMHAEEGDEAIVVIPKYGESTMGALKAIIKKADK